MEKIIHEALKEQHEATKATIIEYIRSMQKIAEEEWSILTAENIITIIKTI